MRIIVAILACALASCGPNLGTHRLVSARSASELPAAVSHSRHDPGYVVLTFDTNADINADNINALYAEARACDGSDAGRMTAFGPFTDTVAPQDLPLRGDRAAVSRYLVYLPVTGEVWGDRGKDGKTPVIGTFDLATNTQDICFNLEHTGYPAATRTGMVRVAALVLKRAIGAPAP
ncbi:MAG: hypothetical protein NBV68_03185 [Erythrobacter sp.]|uniref:hypothetical protein n=1 Tax=Erythrobacter sp. TaxID=1042 RepID=UPI0025DD1F64|nr:hypothetical protein [Erythrobacter sp.]MCL9998361.1 hypothetical protein [Erythrobacter sp.]